MKTTLTVSTSAKHEQLEIRSTSNGYIVLSRPAHDRCEPITVLASFESLASLQRWLSKNLVPR